MSIFNPSDSDSDSDNPDDQPGVDDETVYIYDPGPVIHVPDPPYIGDDTTDSNQDGMSAAYKNSDD